MGNSAFADDPVSANTLIASGTDRSNAYKSEGGFLISTSNEGDTLQLGRGITLAEGLDEVVEGIEKNDPFVSALGITAIGLDVASIVSDPIAYIGGQIVTWMLEHVQPIREAFDKVCGNNDVIQAYSKSWSSIGTEVLSVSEDFSAAVTQGTAQWQGAAGTAYRAYSGVQTGLVASLGVAANAMSELVRIVGEIINGVRTAIRDILAALAGKLISWTVKLLCTVGTGAIAIVAEALAELAKQLSSVSKIVAALIKDLKQFGTTATALRDVVDGIYKALAGPNSSYTTAVIGTA
ncbi:WXG100 family type VII secretion target [Nocardia sp. NPDC058176]|uniref:WXG100 family type VII secretion target n=1 Tax=Nocardia sp. NPDC058176 TaxID=3346368 RepID=UPI0036DF3377